MLTRHCIRFSQFYRQTKSDHFISKTWHSTQPKPILIYDNSKKSQQYRNDKKKQSFPETIEWSRWHFFAVVRWLCAHRKKHVRCAINISVQRSVFCFRWRYKGWQLFGYSIMIISWLPLLLLLSLPMPRLKLLCLERTQPPTKSWYIQIVHLPYIWKW